MKHYEFVPSGIVCSSLIEFDLDDDNNIHNLKFTKGCHGNLSAISKLLEGKSASETIEILKGNQCKNRGTSCADQLSIALQKAINE